MEKNILLESGINQLEIVVFKAGGGTFALNVAKVDSIFTAEPITSIPNSHKNIKGIINYRGMVLPVIDLAQALNRECIIPPEKRLMILVHINMKNFVIEVSQVVGIQRLSWEDIEAPSQILISQNNSSITGIVKKDGEDLILMLDLEKILADTNESLAFEEGEVLEDFKGKTIVVAEDSAFLLQIVHNTFAEAGANVKAFSNGREALDFLEKIDPESIYCVITDIEMPVMDGLTLTKNIKDDPDLRSIPVILFSSIVSDKLKHQGLSVGADDQVTKPELNQLIDKVINIRK